MTDGSSTDKTFSVPRKTVAVIGGGMAGLVAARELANADFAVTLLEAGVEVGGPVSAHEVGGLVLDAGAESYAKRGNDFAELATQLGLADQLVDPNPVGAWLEYAEGKGQPKATPLPKVAILGIPGDLDDPILREVLGRTGLLRAKLDGNLPRGVGAKARTVADLVRARMGQTVLDRLVTPVIGGVYSSSAEELDPDVALPGLRAALREHGSLAAAVAALKTPAGRVKPGSAVGGLRGGVFQIARALRTELEELGVQIKCETKVGSIRPTGTAWHLSIPDAELEVDKVVLATEAAAALDLIREIVPEAEEFGQPEAKVLALVTVVVDLPELDAAPRGTGVLVSPLVPGVRAKALTHATVKWPWLADEEGPGTHVLRLSYPVASSGAEDSAAAPVDLAQALTDASTLLGLEIQEEDVLDWDLIEWTSSVSAAGLGRASKIEAFRAAVENIDGLCVTGAWLAGNGLVSVIADARVQALRLV
ncbi:protoporphyrinogen oxidase [Renibacterium salmoninarum ATCC 33209]|uniref:Protoporphyrinogen oxidase n=1 Tax=Renibacterium salmoninarum (strain ATCC 33209 / DSM 20767 / JCM 11484 / NBRC 15589 / NCIMB 2235) TaxID=288705 RepID=A9WPH3_RENSM|nr:FAD-dependent oxidoreductase [Renibacterium salmoninarum]ABY22958.1 protoporphyrinogen oxidase [Renibacterium salmoninarum ATCC 33209]